MSEHKKRKNARAMLSKMGYKSGGHMASPSDAKEDVHNIKHGISEHENQLHGGKHARIKLKDGGLAHGGMAKPRGDRKSRGGKKHSHTTVNVVVGAHDKPPMPIPVPVGGPAPDGPPMPPPPMAGHPGGLPGAGGPPPGAPPPMQSGGRAGYKSGGSVKIDSQRDKIKGMPVGQFKKGGNTKGFDAGSGSGKGRLEKIKEYGA